jgi:periplasmic protein TonB
MRPFNHSSLQHSENPFMAGAGFIQHLKHYSLAWTLVLSLLLHALIAGLLPPFNFASPPSTLPLVVELVQPKPAPPAEPEPVPEPPQPEPPKPQPKPEPPPVKRAAPPKPIDKPAPLKTPEPPPIEQPAPPEPPPPAPPVISATPKPEAPPPTFTAPPPPPPPQSNGPTEADLESARQAYGNSLGQEIGKYKRYPLIAQKRGWEGTVKLLLEIDGNGKVISVKIEEASEHQAFNTEAQEMVKRMVQPPPIPDALRGRSFTVRVPISFRLE